jgi:hypothetical protein
MNEATAPIYRKKITAEVFAPYPTVAPHEIKWLGKIYGDLRGIETGASAYGPFVKLTGEFIAENSESGVAVTATSCILPAVAEGAILAHLASVGVEAGKIGERLDTGRMVFGMEVGIEGRARKGENDTSSSYQWVARPVSALAQSPVALLKSQMWATPAVTSSEPDPTVPTPNVENAASTIDGETGEVKESKKSAKK